MAKIKTTIDDIDIEVERDSWAIDVARDMGIEIPTLCYHPALGPYGACRLCVVEVTKGKWTWLATACDLPIREGLSIKTDTPEVIKSRKMALELIMARAPKADSLLPMAEKLGVTKPRFKCRDSIGNCILCGLCVRMCDQIIGASAINFANRGHQRIVTTPLHKKADKCIGCNVCVEICPTGHIKTLDDDRFRHMETWNADLEMIHCLSCQKPWMPAKQFKAISQKLEGIELKRICPVCRRKETVDNFCHALVNKM